MNIVEYRGWEYDWEKEGIVVKKTAISFLTPDEKIPSPYGIEDLKKINKFLEDHGRPALQRVELFDPALETGQYGDYFVVSNKDRCGPYGGHEAHYKGQWQITNPFKEGVDVRKIKAFLAWAKSASVKNVLIWDWTPGGDDPEVLKLYGELFPKNYIKEIIKGEILQDGTLELLVERSSFSIGVAAGCGGGKWEILEAPRPPIKEETVRSCGRLYSSEFYEIKEGDRFLIKERSEDTEIRGNGIPELHVSENKLVYEIKIKELNGVLYYTKKYL